MFKPGSAILLCGFLLGGCASVRVIDTEVRSFASTPSIASGATYRFERLPSQQIQEVQQSTLEAMAQEALVRVGLERDDAQARYSVQVSYGLRMDPYPNPGPGTMGWSMGWNLGWGGRGGGVGLGGYFPLMGFPPAMAQPTYWHQVSLVVRNLSSHTVAYETHATHDGLWSDSQAIVPALFEAALRDFPNPPTTVRRINIEIAR